MKDKTRVIDLDAKYRAYKWEEDYTNVNQFMFAIEYDGLNVIDIAEDYPNMTVDIIKRIVMSEGGTIDDKGNISRGSARYNFASADSGEYMKLDAKKESVKAKNLFRALALESAVRFLGKHFVEAYLWVLEEKERRNNTDAMERYQRKHYFAQLEKYGYYIDKNGMIRYSTTGITSSFGKK